MPNELLCRRTKLVLLPLVAVITASCGGGGGLGLSGGSIPTGTITGKLVLPSGQPLTSATTTAANLDTGKAVTVSATVDQSGNFTIADVPITSDVEVTFVNGGTTLKVVVPAQPSASTTPVDVGQVNASTTVAAVAIETEIAAGVDTPSTIVATQLLNCTTNQDNSGEDEDQQNNDVTDPTYRRQSANHDINSTADTEVNTFVDDGSNQTGGIALDGILSYVVANGGQVSSLTSMQRNALIMAQISGTTYTTANIAAALTSAGLNASTTSVSTADKAQESTLPSLSHFTAITPLEAIAIAACSTSTGGFSATPAQLSKFVNALTPTVSNSTAPHRK